MADGGYIMVVLARSVCRGSSRLGGVHLVAA